MNQNAAILREGFHFLKKGFLKFLAPNANDKIFRRVFRAFGAGNRAGVRTDDLINNFILDADGGDDFRHAIRVDAPFDRHVGDDLKAVFRREIYRLGFDGLAGLGDDIRGRIRVHVELLRLNAHDNHIIFIRVDVVHPGGEQIFLNAALARLDQA